MKQTKPISLLFLAKRWLFSVVLITLMSASAIAQVSVSGTILDENGVGLPGVTILEAGTSNGTITDIDGSYSLSVAANSTIQVSFTGYKTQEIAVGQGGTFNLNLEVDAEVLDEVVVTGYQIQRKRDISGSVAVIKAEDIQTIVASSFAQKLQGRAAGVTMSTSGQAGDAANIRIRGISSFGNNDPLYIIDGVQIVDKGNLNLNPNDIESMQVLKDPSTASIYGSRASNGVIVITTKQGKAGKPKLTYSGSISGARDTKGWGDILITDANEFLDMSKQFFTNGGQALPSYIQNDKLTTFIFPATNGDPGTYDRFNNPIMRTSAGTDFWDEMTRTGLVNDHTLSISGGTDKSTYAISAGLLNQEGYINYQKFDRYTVRANSSYKITDWLKVGENVNFARTNRVNGVQQSEQGAASQIYKTIPIIPVYDEGTSVDADGNRNSFGGSKTANTGNSSNPVAMLYRGKDNNNFTNNILGNVYAEITPITGLTFRTSYNVNLSNYNGVNFSFRTPENQENQGAQNFSEYFGTSYGTIFSNTINYTKTLSERHNIGVLVGYESQDSKTRNLNGSLNNYFSIDPNIWYLNAAFGQADTRQVGSNGNQSRLLSMFGKVDYSLDDKYFLSATVRRDGSSKFSPANRYAVFPAVSAAWRISGEDFMKDGMFDDLKLRLSWGKTGNQAIPDYNFVDRWGGSIGSAFYAIDGSNNSATTGYHLTAIGTDALNSPTKWEEGETANIGIDATLLDNKLGVVLDVYRRKTNDLLYNSALPGTVGFVTVPFRNVASMQNTGFDFQITWRDNISKSLSYNIDLNLGRYVNEILKVDDAVDFFYPNGQQGVIDNRLSTNININKVGFPISSFRGFVVDGTFQTQADLDAIEQNPGEVIGGLRFKDLNGDKVINDSDYDIIGNPHPDFFGGLNLGVSFKKFDVNAFLVGSYGNDIFNYTRVFTHFRQFFANVHRDYYLENGTNGTPKLNAADTGSRFASSYYVEDGSYLRLGQLQVGYTIPFAASKVGLSKLKVYAQGQNLLTITGYSGLDPALSNANVGPGNNLNDIWTGYDIGQLPSSKIFTFGVVADF